MTRGKGTSRRWALTRLAIEDVLWLLILLSVALVFQGVLLLARGYYACRRRGPPWAALYAGAVLAGLAWSVVYLASMAWTLMSR